MWAARAWRSPKSSDSVGGEPHLFENSSPQLLQRCPPLSFICPRHVPLWQHTGLFHASHETISSAERLYPEESSLQTPPVLWPVTSCTRPRLPACRPACCRSVSPGTVPSLLGSVPERMKYSRRYPKKRSIALYLEADAEMKCKPFSPAVSQIQSENVCSHLTVAHFQTVSELPGTHWSMPGFCFCSLWLWLWRPLLFFHRSLLHLPFPRKSQERFKGEHSICWFKTMIIFFFVVAKYCKPPLPLLLSLKNPVSLLIDVGNRIFLFTLSLWNWSNKIVWGAVEGGGSV